MGGRRGRAPCLLPPLGPSAATWRRHGHSASLGPPPEGGGAPRPSPPCRDIGGCGGPRHALVPSPYRNGSTWLMLYLKATGFEARAVRTPRNAPSLVTVAGRLRARPRGQSRLGLEALRVHSGAPAHSAGRQDTGTVSLGCGAAISPPPQGNLNPGNQLCSPFASARRPHPWSHAPGRFVGGTDCRDLAETSEDAG